MPRYASLVSRALALLTDVVILAFLIAATDFLIQQVGRQLLAASFLEPGRCAEATEWWRLRTWLCRGLPWVLPVSAFCLPPLYRVTFWTVTGQTPGMVLFGLRVLRANGSPVGLGTALRRLLGYVACALTFGLGFFAVVLSARRQGLHDRIAGTVVVHDWLDRAERALREPVRGRETPRRPPAAPRPA